MHTALAAPFSGKDSGPFGNEQNFQPQENMNPFKKLGLSDNIVAALEKKGFEQPTPIQERTIPMLLSETTDIVAQASTGTGKTAAFGLPILERADESVRAVQSLVLAPTRELAIQVADEINSLKGDRKLRVVPVYGGQYIGMQLKSLRRGVDVVVGTPGRILDHLNRGSLDLSHIDMAVLDEADEMCDMGFIDDIRDILSQSNPERQTLLFSATMPPQVMRIASEFMGEYQTVSVKPKKSETPLTTQVFHEIAESDRFEALCRVIDAEPDFRGLVFCRTRADADEVASRLAERGYPAEPIHGDLNQARREHILGKFRNGSIDILAATDVAARGIDVPDLSHVVNFALPQDHKTFVHRVGRTGRAGKEGKAVTLIAPREFRRLMFICRATGMEITKEQLPRIEDVIYNKKTRIVAQLDEIFTTEDFETYMPLARELLQERDADQAMAALLRYAFGEELEQDAYREIRDVRHDQRGRQGRGGGGGGGGRVRMVASVGRKQGMNPRKFVDFLVSKTKTRPFKIQNVKVQNLQTEFSVPEQEVKFILRGMSRGGGPKVQVKNR
jgi:ATP-dependent RNA helicase DeaD